METFDPKSFAPASGHFFFKQKTAYEIHRQHLSKYLSKNTWAKILGKNTRAKCPSAHKFAPRLSSPSRDSYVSLAGIIAAFHASGTRIYRSATATSCHRRHERRQRLAIRCRQSHAELRAPPQNILPEARPLLRHHIAHLV